MVLKGTSSKGKSNRDLEQAYWTRRPLVFLRNKSPIDSNGGDLGDK